MTSSPDAQSASFITENQVKALRMKLQMCDSLAEEAFLKIAKIERLEQLPAADYDEAVDWATRREKKFRASK